MLIDSPISRRLGQVQVAPIIAAEAGAAEALASRSIWPGVITGVLVYTASRIIDRMFFSGGKR